MSALGQKRTHALQKAMSALPPKATSNATYGNVHVFEQARALREVGAGIQVLSISTVRGTRLGIAIVN